MKRQVEKPNPLKKQMWDILELWGVAMHARNSIIEPIYSLFESQIQQARAEVAREMIEEIEEYWSLHVPSAITYLKISRQDWQSLKDEFLKDKSL